MESEYNIFLYLPTTQDSLRVSIWVYIVSFIYLVDSTGLGRARILVAEPSEDGFRSFPLMSASQMMDNNGGGDDFGKISSPCILV